ncbi:MAG: XRE family transcriptional regulator [Myxococcota bacterium]
MTCDDFHSEVAWRATQGFGLFTRPPEFSDRPDEIYQPPLLAAKRLAQLYENRKTSSEPIPLWLTSIRQLRGTPQTSLAEKLSQSQAAISQLERREDIRLSTLRRYVEAMGGRLEMKVVFEEFSAVVDVAPSDKTGEK